MSTTTIRLSKDTLNKINKLKMHRRETYEDVICRLIEENHGRKKRK